MITSNFEQIQIEIEANTFCTIASTIAAQVNFQGSDYSVYYYEYEYNFDTENCELIEERIPLASGILLQTNPETMSL